MYIVIVEPYIHSFTVNVSTSFRVEWPLWLAKNVPVIAFLIQTHQTFNCDGGE